MSSTRKSKRYYDSEYKRRIVQEYLRGDRGMRGLRQLQILEQRGHLLGVIVDSIWEPRWTGFGSIVDKVEYFSGFLSS